MTNKKLRIIWLGSAAALGAVGGFLYYHFVGCNGACMIWSSPWISTAYGALLGWLIAGLLPIGTKKNNSSRDEDNVAMAKEDR